MLHFFVLVLSFCFNVWCTNSLSMWDKHDNVESGLQPGLKIVLKWKIT